MTIQAEIEAALQLYFDGLYEGDVDKLARVFHPSAVLSSATDGSLAQMTCAEYLDLVRSRPSPKSRNAPRVDKVLSIDTSGPNAAVAKVECAVHPRYFTDFNTFAKVDGTWRIVSKIYHYTVKE